MLKRLIPAYGTGSSIRPSRNLCFRCYATRILGKDYEQDEWTNVPSSILALTPRKLHLQDNHPISILRKQIESQLSEDQYARYNTYDPVVTTHQNFDSLGFPDDHVGRSKSDTYYVNKDTVLRTHTSAHQVDTFRDCTKPGFLISADVYRRDEIDKSHYPVFHQTEGARSWRVHDGLVAEIDAEIAAMPTLNIVVEDPNPPNHEVRNPVQPGHDKAQSEAVARHLKRTIEGIAAEVFGRAAQAARQAQKTEDGTGNVWAPDAQPLRVRWIEAYFPFTSPSWELEVWWDGAWLELCGCGVVTESIMHSSRRQTKDGGEERIAWAFGLGLERIAMILFGIPDIRLFWSLDDRFLSQFASGSVVPFRAYSKYPVNRQDLSFWCPPTFQENDFMEIVRTEGGDLVESVDRIDEFTHPKTGRRSLCYRITYRSMDRSLSNEEVSDIQARIQRSCKDLLSVEIR